MGEPLPIYNEESALSSAGEGDRVWRKGSDKVGRKRKEVDVGCSRGVVRGMIEWPRGPHRPSAAGQGEENSMDERKKRLREAERETVGDLGERSGKYFQGELLMVGQACSGAVVMTDLLTIP